MARGDLDVVRLGPHDAPEVIALEAALGAEGVPLERARRMLSLDGHYAFGVRTGGRLVALAVGIRITRWRKDKLMLYEIDTDPAYRRRGAARALVETLREVAVREGLQSMFVVTEEANSAAMALYEGTGAIRAHPDDVLWHWETG